MNISYVLEHADEVLQKVEDSVAGDIQIKPTGSTADFWTTKGKTFTPRFSEYGHFFKKRNMFGDMALNNTRIAGVSLSGQSTKTIPTRVCYTATTDVLDQHVLAYIEIEPHCNVLIDEEFFNDADFKIYKIVYVVREGATVNIRRKINVGGSHDTIQIIETEVIQHPGSTFNIYTQDGIQDYLQDIYFVEALQDTVTNITGRYFGKLNNNIHVITDIDHVGTNCKSNVDVKSVTDNQSRFTFAGNLTVRQEAEGADAHLSNKNLQLVDTVTVITEPKLDISTKEIACTHGCTVSSIDKDQLYLLNTRGIDNNTSQQILTDAFLNG